MRRFLASIVRFLSAFPVAKPTPPHPRKLGARIANADKWRATNEHARRAEEHGE